MTSPTVFSLKFDSDNDDIEIIQESEYNSTGFQNEFYNSISRNTPKAIDTPTAGSSCYKCGKQYKYIALLNSHLKSCEGRKVATREILHVCQSCKKAYKSRMAYEKHVIRCSQTTPCLVDRRMCFCCEEPLKNCHVGWLQCAKCSKSFSTEKGHARHQMLLHSNSVNFKCELCNAQCSNNYILKLHRQTHNDDLDRLDRTGPEYNCNLCHKSFLDKIAFDIHINNHKRENIQPVTSYSCKMCNSVMTSLEEFNSHSCQKVERGKYKCNLCGRYLSSFGFYRRHINTHRKYNESSSSLGVDVTLINSENNNSKFEIKEEIVETSSDAKYNVQSFSDSFVLKNESTTMARGNTPSNEVRILNGKCTGSSYQQIEEPKDGESNQIDFEQIVQNIKKEDLHEDNYFPMEEATLKESIISFLKIVLDAELLEQFGFPDAPVEKVLANVLERLECKPSRANDVAVQLRENVKILLKEVVDDSCAINTIDRIEAIDIILREVIKNSS